MRRIATLVATGALLVALTAGGALAAAAFYGTPGEDDVRGTPAIEYIETYAGDDTVYPRGGRDTVSSGRGDDYINTAGDQVSDRVNCGKGHDTLEANPYDRVEGTPASEVVQEGLTTACEKVRLP